MVWAAQSDGSAYHRLLGGVADTRACARVGARAHATARHTRTYRDCEKATITSGVKPQGPEVVDGGYENGNRVYKYIAESFLGSLPGP